MTEADALMAQLRKTARKCGVIDWDVWTNLIYLLKTRLEQDEREKQKDIQN